VAERAIKPNKETNVDKERALQEIQNDINELLQELVDAVNKAMSKGMPAKIVKSLMERILVDVRRPQGLEGCHITFMGTDGRVIAGERYQPDPANTKELGRTITNSRVEVQSGELRVVDLEVTELKGQMH